MAHIELNSYQHVTVEMHFNRLNESDCTKTSSSNLNTSLLLLFEPFLDLLRLVELNQPENVLIAHNSLNELSLCYFT